MEKKNKASIIKKVGITIFELLEDICNGAHLDMIVRCIIVVLIIYYMSQIGVSAKMGPTSMTLFAVMLMVWAIAPLFRMFRKIFETDNKKEDKYASRKKS